MRIDLRTLIHRLLILLAILCVSVGHATPGNCENCANKGCIALMLHMAAKEGHRLTPGRIDYGGISYEIPKFSGKGFTLAPQVSKNKLSEKSLASKVVRSISQVWNLKEFNTPREPLVVHTLQGKEDFSKRGAPRVLELPIKVKGGIFESPSS